MDGDTPITIDLLSSLSQIDAEEWDACACPEEGRPSDPFTTYRFLDALEQSGSVGPGSGWQPRYLVARHEDKAIACAPMYAKGHSQGEYIFDHNWAHAYENAGGEYYPKLQIAAPFTPATGRRFLTRPGWEAVGISALIQGAVQVAADNDLSSLHVTFCTEDEAIAGEKIGLMRRASQQFHWMNDGYETFDDFLASLSSRKRKNIRKERERAQNFGGEIVSLTGDAIRPEHWDAFWRFYQDTGARKWGQPYLTRDFFDIAHQTMAQDMLLCLAIREGQPVAGALNFIGAETLYGRYWGCTEDHPCLHFELCYYQAIDYAIKNGLKRVEAGAQGTHKLARGYMPVTTHSLHWVRDAGFAEAIGKYLEAERAAVDEEIEVLTGYGPFRKANVEEPE
ncbi:GNAT family N-acetyltransferase [Gymnodinialimonas hymeniacidonis]|uniref:GNAT family N-acetyltransferase n=1 Tax=Gymnodinialimonas hymeniacidonis TaxID=3126508 RepID=UPI0034C67741